VKEAGTKVTVIGAGAKEYNSKIDITVHGGVIAESVNVSAFDVVIMYHWALRGNLRPGDKMVGNHKSQLRFTNGSYTHIRINVLPVT